jgi:23S rRNA pseudouridine1911/1915/1917 synthase
MPTALCATHLPWAYFRGMEQFTVSHPVELVEALMSHVGFSTRTRARNALKRGQVLVGDKVAFKGSAVLEPGVKVVVLSAEEAQRLERAGGTARTTGAKGAAGRAAAAKAPFPVVYEDDNVFVYEKPAGWVCASANPKVRTTYTLVKKYLESQSSEVVDVHFVNKLPMEASGLLVVAKSLAWRKHLQDQWKTFDKGLYLMLEGHLPADDVLHIRPESGQPYDLEYRTMRATDKHTLLKVKAGDEVVKDLLPALRREDCMLVGVGKTAPNPMGRGGLHLFALALVGPEGERVNVKTRVPSEFLKLVRGGSSPKTIPNKKKRGFSK